MRLKRIFSMAWGNMKLRKLRTFLTTLGVVIGITAIIALASLGEGFRVSIREQLEQGFELDVLTVIPGSFFVGGIEKFTDTEVAKVREVSNISVATPITRAPRSVELYNEDKNVTALVAAGVNFTEFAEEVFPDRFRRFEEGGIPEQIKNNTVILGYKVNHLNETESAFAHPNDNITMTLTIADPFPMLKNYTFNVAGTLEKTGTAGFTSWDYWVFIPLDTARKIYGNLTDLIFVKVRDPEFSESVAEEIENLFPPYNKLIRY